MTARMVFALALLLAVPLQADQTGGWVYPSREYRASNGMWVYPTTDGKRFNSAMEREAYLRSSRQVRKRALDAEREALRRREAVPERPRVPAPPIFQEPVAVPTRRESREDTLSRERLDATTAAQQERQRRLQSFLRRSNRADALGTSADLAQQRSLRAQRIARGEDRLYSGAAAGRSSLGERTLRPTGPLIAVPKVGD